MGLLDGTISEQRLPGWVTFCGHYLAAAIGCAIVGLLADALFAVLFGETIVAAVHPGTATVGFAAGFMLMRRFRNRPAMWVWVGGLLWFSLGVRELAAGWHPAWSHHTRSGEVAANLFGRSELCGETECLYEFLFTIPLIATVGYSIGAAVAANNAKRGRQEST